uniref:MARVEL domain-containing protein n=1 Tax=Mola mola TaxID=94237 RepID=A0A3Q3WDD6_MOLML
RRAAHGAMEETAGAERGFDLFKFVRHPRTIVRLLSWLFGMVVFACITTEGYINTPFDPEAKCIFNQDYSTCRYAVSIGVIGFLACVFFLFVLCLCICVSVRVLGVWTFLWFVCFCLLAAQWARTKDTRGIPQDAAHATIAFSFFSMATWVIASLSAAELRLDYHHTPYPPTYAPTTYTPTAYSAYPSRVSEIHQQPPFTSERQPQGDTGYLPSDYQPSDYQPSNQQPSSYQPPSY